jgi:hypothetical protein
MSGMLRPVLAAAVLCMVSALVPSHVSAQGSTTLINEIPIERCDRLPVVRVRIGTTEMRFLLDTGATTVLNLKSFGNGLSKEIQVTSWTGTTATSAREVSLRELSLGKHQLRDLKLPAIDLSAIGNACGGPIDGNLGVDLLDKMEVTIDLKHQVASLGVDPIDPKTVYAEMETSMGSCTVDFERGRAEEFQKCLDPEIVLYTPHGEFRGREEVMGYMRHRFFKFAPNVHYTMCTRDLQMFGYALWYSYDYTLETPAEHLSGHGMAMCRKSEGRWRILNMHDSIAEPSTRTQP